MNDNVYLDAFGLEQELPRLQKQSRLLYQLQLPVLPTLPKPNPPGDFLDIGTGPGVFLSLLQNHPDFKDYRFTGLDLSKELLFVAGLHNNNIDWVQGSAYALPFPDHSFDLVHASFLFIHLLEPEKALAEIQRVLRPGGYAHIVDINDSTFQGAEVLETLVKAHGEVHAGDRTVLDKLPELVNSQDLCLACQQAVTVDNSGTQESPLLEDFHLRLPPHVGWSLLSFMGQRPEIKEEFEAAKNAYEASSQPFSIQLQTQVYRKPSQ